MGKDMYYNSVEMSTAPLDGYVLSPEILQDKSGVFYFTPDITSNMYNTVSSALRESYGNIRVVCLKKAVTIMGVVIYPFTDSNTTFAFSGDPEIWGGISRSHVDIYSRLDNEARSELLRRLSREEGVSRLVDLGDEILPGVIHYQPQQSGGIPSKNEEYLVDAIINNVAQFGIPVKNRLAVKL